MPTVRRRFLKRVALWAFIFLTLMGAQNTLSANVKGSSVFLLQENYFSPGNNANENLQNYWFGADTLIETPSSFEFSDHKAWFKTDLTAMARTDQKLSFLNLRDLFGSYSYRISNEKALTFSLGRKKMSWSLLDDQWGLGLWQPLFFWSPLSPEPQGQTGLFTTFGSTYWEATLLISPLFIPHQTPPYSISNGSVISPHRWMPLIPLPTSATLQGQTLPIHYNLVEPSKESVVFQPTTNAKLTFWPIPTTLYLSLVYGSKASHDPRFRIDDPYLQLQGSSQKVAVAINPEFYRHTLIGVESGWQESNWDFSLSSIQESLLQTPTEEVLYFHYRPLKSWGGTTRWKTQFLNLNLSWMKRSDGDPTITGPNQNLFTYTPFVNSAALYSNAIKITFHRPPLATGWSHCSLDGFVTLIRDWDWNSSVIQSEIRFLFPFWNFTLGAEVVGFTPAPEEPAISFFGQAQSNDRYYIEASYLF